MRLIEDRLRGLKLRVPVEGLRLKLAPDADRRAGRLPHAGRNPGPSSAGEHRHAREVDLA